eukprot:2720618-Prymnesium_polylepis.1
MEYARDKLDDRRLVRVLVGELDVQFRRQVLPQRVLRAEQTRVPLHDVAADRLVVEHHAFRRVGAHALDVLHDAPTRRRRHLLRGGAGARGVAGFG